METEGLKKHGRIPKPSGRYAVGCTDIMTSPGAEGVFFRLFYPTEAAEAAESASWLPDKNYLKGYAKYFKMWPPIFTSLFPVIIGEIDVPAFWNIPPLNDGQQKFPVMVFSHGLGSCRTTYTTVCLELASNGYVVAAVEHRDLSANASFYFEDENDGENISSEQSAAEGPFGSKSKKKKYLFIKQVKANSKAPVIRNKQVHIRSKECSMVLDWLQSLNDGGDVKNVLKTAFQLTQFQGLLDFSKASICGHSFGGATAIITMAEDKRFKVGVSLDPWMVPLIYDISLFKDITQEMLFINTATFQTEEDLRIMKKIEASGPKRLQVTTLKGTLHLNQTDVPFIGSRIMRWYLGSHSRLDRFLAMDLTTRLTMIFLAKHLDLPVNENYVNYLKTHEEVVMKGLPEIPEPA